ncbi:hypothetical protein BDAP_001858 [Binucleata daphniae]
MGKQTVSSGVVQQKVKGVSSHQFQTLVRNENEKEPATTLQKSEVLAPKDIPLPQQKRFTMTAGAESHEQLLQADSPTLSTRSVQKKTARAVDQRGRILQSPSSSLNALNKPIYVGTFVADDGKTYAIRQTPIVRRKNDPNQAKTPKSAPNSPQITIKGKTYRLKTQSSASQLSTTLSDNLAEYSEIHELTGNEVTRKKKRNVCLRMLGKVICYIFKTPFKLLLHYGSMFIGLILFFIAITSLILWQMGLDPLLFLKMGWSVVTGTMSIVSCCYNFSFLSGCAGCTSCTGCASSSTAGAGVYIKDIMVSWFGGLFRGASPVASALNGLSASPVAAAFGGLSASPAAAAFGGLGGAVAGAFVSESIGFSALGGSFIFFIIGFFLFAFITPIFCSCAKKKAKSKKAGACSGIFKGLGVMLRLFLQITSIILSVWYFNLIITEYNLNTAENTANNITMDYSGFVENVTTTNLY